MTRTRAWTITGAIALGLTTLPILGLVGLYQLAFGVLRVGDVPVPEFAPANWARDTAADPGPVQGWSPADARAYHHLSQGTVILPVAWFRALEQPLATPLPVGRFAERSYLRRFGFNHDEGTARDAADPGARDLPIGFSVERLEAPYADEPWDFVRPTGVVGLTCAACHTGRIDLAREGVVRSALIEGGGAMIDLKQFQDALGISLYLTKLFPERFRRFAERIAADPDGADPDPATIRRQLESLIDQGTRLIAFTKEKRLIPVEAGFGRTDALDLIGNRVFGVADDQNQSVANAPVNFPHLWDTSWFDWVQYNASIRTPMARNIGEALGVMALLKLGRPGPAPGDLLGTVRSSVNVENLARLEDQLGGAEALGEPGRGGGLQPPRWAEVMAELAGVPPRTPLPEPLAVNPILAAEGRELYARYCQGCHLHPRDELQAKLRAGDDFPAPDENFTPPDWKSGKRFLKLRVVDLDAIGTDPNHALNFFRRVVVTDKAFAPPDPTRRGDPAPARPPEVSTISAQTGLYRVTSLLRAQQYRSLNVFDRLGQLERFDRFRSVPELKPRDDATRQLHHDLNRGDPAAIEGGEAMEDVIRAPLGYKARPLDGVWATPPFLHNGSVPTLDDLLRPAAERPEVFYTGSTRFDPVKVGYETSQFAGATRFDTRESGNRNAGHEFRDLTLAEMEAAAGITPRPSATDDQRLARVLSVPDRELVGLDAAARAGRIRDFTRRIYLQNPGAPPIKGRIGPGLTDGERARLLAYLKSI